MMGENLFIYVEQSRVKHLASLFSAKKKNDQKMKEGKEKKESDTWMDWYLRSRSCQIFIQKLYVLDYADYT